MRSSERLNIPIPELDDAYNIDVYSSLINTIDTSMVVGTGVGAIRAVTEEEYAALETKNSSTLYAVTSETGFRLMLGELPLNAGASPQVSDNFTSVLAALNGSITDNWEEETNDGNPGIHDS